MYLYILKTDLKSKDQLEELSSVLNFNASVDNWSIDLEDIDRVLRIEASDRLTYSETIKLVKSAGVNSYDLV